MSARARVLHPHRAPSELLAFGIDQTSRHDYTTARNAASDWRRDEDPRCAGPCVGARIAGAALAWGRRARAPPYALDCSRLLAMMNEAGVDGAVLVPPSGKATATIMPWRARRRIGSVRRYGAARIGSARKPSSSRRSKAARNAGGAGDLRAGAGARMAGNAPPIGSGRRRSGGRPDHAACHRTDGTRAGDRGITRPQIIIDHFGLSTRMVNEGRAGNASTTRCRAPSCQTST